MRKTPNPPPDFNIFRASSAEMGEISRLRGKPHKAYADAFFKAAKHGWNWAMQTLLQMPASESGGQKITADICNEFGSTAIMYASANGMPKSVQFLISSKADVNKQDTLGSSPLMLAAEKNHLIVVNLLLDHGAKTDLKNGLGKTALHLAVENNSHLSVRALLLAKADPTIRDDQGKTPLDRARDNKNDRLEEILAAPTAAREEENRLRREKEAQQRLENNLKALDRFRRRKPPGRD